jgi:hypothetical protein
MPQLILFKPERFRSFGWIGIRSAFSGYDAHYRLEFASEGRNACDTDRHRPQFLLSTDIHKPYWQTRPTK